MTIKKDYFNHDINVNVGINCKFTIDDLNGNEFVYVEKTVHCNILSIWYQNFLLENRRNHSHTKKSAGKYVLSNDNNFTRIIKKPHHFVLNVWFLYRQK